MPEGLGPIDRWRWRIGMHMARLIAGRELSDLAEQTNEHEVFIQVAGALLDNDNPSTRRALPIDLAYDQSDAWAVKFRFHTGEDSEPEWTFSRTTLPGSPEPYIVDGADISFSRPTAANGQLADHYTLGLDSSSGHCLVELPCEPVDEFTRRVYDLVPPGSDDQAYERQLNDDLAKAFGPGAI